MRQRPTVIAALGLLALPATARPQDAPEPTVVEVTGTGQVSVPVDQARILFAVQTDARVAQEAVAENATLMQAVIAAVRRTGLEGLELETTGFNLQPIYGRPTPGSNEPTLESYRAVNNLSVIITDVEAVGTLLDVGVEAGANRVASLSFTAQNIEAARIEALERAVEAARQEAGIMAGALGMRLGSPVEVRGGAQRASPMARGMAFEAQAVGTPVETGDRTVSASVTIRYRLIPAGRP